MLAFPFSLTGRESWFSSSDNGPTAYAERSQSSTFRVRKYAEVRQYPGEGSCFGKYKEGQTNYVQASHISHTSTYKHRQALAEISDMGEETESITQPVSTKADHEQKAYLSLKNI